MRPNRPVSDRLGRGGEIRTDREVGYLRSIQTVCPVCSRRVWKLRLPSLLGYQHSSSRSPSPRSCGPVFLISADDYTLSSLYSTHAIRQFRDISSPCAPQLARLSSSPLSARHQHGEQPAVSSAFAAAFSTVAIRTALVLRARAAKNVDFCPTFSLWSAHSAPPPTASSQTGTRTRRCQRRASSALVAETAVRTFGVIDVRGRVPSGSREGGVRSAWCDDEMKTRRRSERV